jgi:hypothetical protein
VHADLGIRVNSVNEVGAGLTGVLRLVFRDKQLIPAMQRTVGEYRVRMAADQPLQPRLVVRAHNFLP